MFIDPSRICTNLKKINKLLSCTFVLLFTMVRGKRPRLATSVVEKTKHIFNLYECCDDWYQIQPKKIQNGGMLNFNY